LADGQLDDRFTAKEVSRYWKRGQKNLHESRKTLPAKATLRLALRCIIARPEFSVAARNQRMRMKSLILIAYQARILAWKKARARRLLPVLLGIAILVPGTALSQAYPSKPIRFILNVSVGVLSDIIMRVGTAELAKQTGQPWVIENRPGGNFIIGANSCKAATPDGYTVCMVNELSMSLNPHIMSSLSYDPEKDFKPITNLYVQVSGIVVPTSLGTNSIGELVKLAASKPGALNFATLGPRTTQDNTRQWMNNRYKIDVVEVPYKGMPLVLAGMMTGETSVSQIALGTLGAYLTSGKVKLLAVNSSRRLAKLPDVPTFNEAGLGDYVEIAGRMWWGLVAPAGFPDPAVQRLNAEFHKLFAQPKFAELLDNQFVDPVLGTPEEFAAFLKKDRERAGRVVKQFKIPRQ
jgi:tripartite-type tricarboxylate transporter receptor subunit TctC